MTNSKTLGKLLLTSLIVLSSAAAQAKQPARPAGCDTFGTTAIPYAGNPPATCADHDDHFRSMTAADWDRLNKGEIEAEAKRAANDLAALKHNAELRALR